MSVNDTLFGPLGKEYCLLFYVISALSLFMLVIAVIYTLYILFAGNKSERVLIPTFIAGIITYGIAYLQGRLLYNICGKTM